VSQFFHEFKYFTLLGQQQYFDVLENVMTYSNLKQYYSRYASGVKLTMQFEILYVNVQGIVLCFVPVAMECETFLKLIYPAAITYEG
jgi:hypothetical protein